MQVSPRWAGILLLYCALFVLCLPGEQAKASPVTVNKIAAVVNGEMITLHDLQNYTSAELARQNIGPNDPKRAEVMRGVLDSMIMGILLRQEAARLKVSVASAEVDAEIKQWVQRSGLSQENFEKQLARQGGSLSMLKERIQDGLLRQRMITLMISRKVVVTKEEVTAYYKEHQAEFGGEKSAEFSLIAFPPSVKVDAIVTHIRSGALSFEEAAQKYSVDPSAKNGGKIGKVAWKGVTPQMQQLLGSLRDGEVSKLLRSDKVSLLVQRHSVTEGKPLTAEEAAVQAEDKLRQPRLQERFKEYTQQLRSKAVIDIRL